MGHGFFSDVVLTDAHITALENRALREQYVRWSDSWISDFCTPTECEATIGEQVVGDLLCLYDRVWLESRRFDLSGLNRFAAGDPVNVRPDLVRDALWWVESRKWRSERHAELFKQFSKQSLKQAVDDSFWEAGFLLTRDFWLHIADAQRSFQQQVPLKAFDDLDNLNTSHAVASNFLFRNRNILVQVIQRWFSCGGFNHFLDSFTMRELGAPKQFLIEFEYISKCRRFEHYFLHLQEWFIVQAQNSLFGRLSGIEQAYRTCPDVPLLADYSVDSASVILRFRLSDVIEYFPLPRTLEEAFEYRSSAPTIHFREALERWIGSVVDDASFEQKARRELQLAARGFRQLKRIRSLRSNPIFFGVKTAASLIPGVSVATTVVDAVDYFFERSTSKRFGWVAHPELAMKSIS